jgi:hypothetical protein
MRNVFTFLCAEQVTITDAAIFGTWFKPVIGEYLVASVKLRREPLN